MTRHWVVSDHHFGHANVIKYCNRPFACADDMDRQMILNHNQLVKKQDKVFILGDFSFHGAQTTARIVEQLNGYKVLILGNHDRRRSYSRWLNMGFNEVYKYPILYNSAILLSHKPIRKIKGLYNIHGHLHNVVTTFEDDSNYLNVSVEVLDYAPILLKEPVAQ